MEQEIIINKHLFKAQSFEELFDEHDISTEVAMKIQALPLVNITEGALVDMGDMRLLSFDDFIEEEFSDLTLKDIVKTMLQLRYLRIENERQVKSKMRFIRAVCEAQPEVNEDGTRNVFLLPTDAVDFLNDRLEKEEKNFRVHVEVYSQEKYLNSCILFDEPTATYFFNVSEVKEPMTVEKFTELWKGQ